jgi:hypothetical protein
MRVLTLTHKRICILTGSLSLFVLLFCLAFPFIEFFAHYTTRFIDGQHPFGGYPIHSAAQMPLPSVAVEPGPKLCCRMDVCDFRFPLPKRTGVATVDSVSGGGDTIKGVIYVTNADGGTVDLRAYAKLVHRAGFRVTEVSDLTGHDSFSATSPDGGLLQVDAGQPTKIEFSFFGDY